MALQDLTPQLRTRLSRMERAVGWFVFVATALLLFGFGYYIYHTAERKGWFKIKAPFFTYVQSSEGLNVNDPVVMMGFQVGQITLIHAMPPGDPHNVRVEFEILDPYFRYHLDRRLVFESELGGFSRQAPARSHARHERPGDLRHAAGVHQDDSRTGADHHHGNQPLAALPGCPRRKFQHRLRRLHDAHAIEPGNHGADEPWNPIPFASMTTRSSPRPHRRVVASQDAPLRKFHAQFR